MTTNDENSEESKPASDNPADRLEEIKSEEKEDASSYYAQGSSGDKGMTEEEFNKPVPAVDSDEEEMSLLKAVAFLGFGMAALAIIFILFFIRDLGNKVGDIDSAVATLETKFGPIKDQMESGFARVDQDVNQLKEKFGSYEKQVAIMELKRAKVAIQEVTANSDPEMQGKSGLVIASIDTLLAELGAGEAPVTGGMDPMSSMSPVEEAPAVEPEPEPVVEEAPHESPVVEHVEEPAATEEPSPGVIELASEGESGSEEGGDEASEESSAAEEAPADEGGDDEEEEDDEDEEE